MARKRIPFAKGERFYRRLDRYYRNDSTYPSIEKRIAALKQGFDYAGTLAKNQPVNLSALGKQNSPIVYRKTNKLDRDQLFNSIDSTILSVQGGLANGKYRLGYGTGLIYLNALDTTALSSLRTYLGRNFNTSAEAIDDEYDFFQLQRSFFAIPNSSPNAITYYFFGFHIRAGWFNLILFIPGKGIQVAYKARFEKDQISMGEIELLFAQEFNPLVQKLYDSYSK
jgi:hypothetical protein